jgi:hypothetical protein
MIPTSAILATLLAITPEECNKRPEWCTCMQYIAMQENRCNVRADSIPNDKERNRVLKKCAAEYKVGTGACAKDDGDQYRYADHIGQDRDSAADGDVRLSTR